MPVNVAGVEAVVRAFYLRCRRYLRSSTFKTMDESSESYGEMELVDGPSLDEWETQLAEDEIDKLLEELDKYDFHKDQGKYQSL